MNLTDPKTQALYAARARIIKALAHPSRLFIIDALAEKEYCVCEITAMVGADMSTVSKHLSVLKAAGIVDDDKRGTTVYYNLKTPCVRNFIACTETVMRTRLQEQIDLIGAA